MSKEKLFRLAERTLKRTEAYQDNRELDVPDSENYKIDYLLVKGGKSASEDVIAYASYEDEMLRFRPLEEKDKPFWDSSAKFDTEIDLFQYLEEGYSLAGMSPDCHYCVWLDIAEYHCEYKSQNGMQKYLDYCKRNGITKDRLAKETDYDGMDVMTLYDREAAKTAPEKKPKDFER
ncbi:hypothetical protein SAMN05444424_2761 [Bittarella massiliensis (ex Durand et al. 2017)]|uniref:Uncharacterized protein n=2 Tax=Clostridia TaxID=186801 RepID=A0AAQ1MFT8_9FIRM|nr:hypothetical protein HMPREF0262_01037 [Clostridium sp. ATCC 29733]SHG58104.1 hypothetical protein SAMN05444424_2761 [Bittarella massiliensis (ex Durand et al. 2017)]